MRTVLTSLMLGLAFSTSAQIFEINLAEKGSKIKTVDHGKNITVILKNRLPLGDYQIKVIRSAVPMPPLDLPGSTDAANLAAKIAGKCTKLEAAYEALGAVTQEENISAAYDDLVKEVQSADNTDCATVIGLANKRLAATSTLVWSDELEQGEQIEITITRDNGGAPISWMLTLTTQPHGRWEISYGFNYITQWFYKEDLYYTKAGADGTFVITKEHNRRTISLGQSVMFTYLPFNHDWKGWNFGISPGLGTDLNTATLFLAATLTYRQNFRMHAGLAFNRQYVLVGRYAENDTISADLSFEQLNEKQLRVNPFIAFSFRFRENIFDRE